MGTKGGGNSLGSPLYFFDLIFEFLSYAHDSKCATFIWTWRMFYIFTTYACDAKKSFYGLFKKKFSPKLKFLKLCRTWEYYVNFLAFGENFFFEKLVETFLCIAGVRCEYVKHSLSPDESSPLWIVSIRQKLENEIEKLKGGEPKVFPPLFPCRDSK